MCLKPAAPYFRVSTSFRQNIQPYYPLNFLYRNSYNERIIEELIDISQVFVFSVKMLITLCYVIRAYEHISTLFVDRNLFSQSVICLSHLPAAAYRITLTKHGSTYPQSLLSKQTCVRQNDAETYLLTKGVCL